MGFSSQKFCTERFLFRGNIDCVFLHNNFIKNINYLPKTVNQTRCILFSYFTNGAYVTFVSDIWCHKGCVKIIFVVPMRDQNIKKISFKS